MIPTTFINYAGDLLGDTEKGLTGNKIAELFTAYALDYGVSIPYSDYPFLDVPNKRTALKENLKAFTPQQQFIIIKELCELDQFKQNSDIKDLKIKLISRYGHLSTRGQEVNEALTQEVLHWLSEYPESLKLYKEALAKLENQVFERNLLDDLRLSLELLLKDILQNNKSLENQINSLGQFTGQKSVSKELINMFVKLVGYYCDYQNTYIKHNDSVIENEIEIIFEMTSSFMKFIARIK